LDHSTPSEHSFSAHKAFGLPINYNKVIASTVVDDILGQLNNAELRGDKQMDSTQGRMITQDRPDAKNKKFSQFPYEKTCEIQTSASHLQKDLKQCQIGGGSHSLLSGCQRTSTLCVLFVYYLFYVKNGTNGQKGNPRLFKHFLLHQTDMEGE
jgi:hypothetical protein